MPTSAWRNQLVPASYNGVLFYVELQSRASGYRLVPHEFPKRDIPWTENMGRRVRHWQVHGYLVYSPVNMPDVFGQRDELIAQLETPGAGVLVLPTGLQNMNDESPGAVEVDTYAVTEHRDRGGWVEFEMTFVEAGQSPSSLPTADTQSTTNAMAQSAIGAAQTTSDFSSLAPTSAGISSPFLTQGNVSIGTATSPDAADVAAAGGVP